MEKKKEQKMTMQELIDRELKKREPTLPSIDKENEKVLVMAVYEEEGGTIGMSFGDHPVKQLRMSVEEAEHMVISIVERIQTIRASQTDPTPDSN